jgi:hypothetical protein
MKKIVYSFIALVVLVFSMSCEKEEFVGVDDLPTAGVNFLDQYFTGIKVSNVKKEKEGLSGTEYTAYLENGMVVKFDKNGTWEEVDAPDNLAIPISFIPNKIVDYVTEYYPSADINGIDQEKSKYDVELTNGLDLEFNSAGKFVRMD